MENLWKVRTSPTSCHSNCRLDSTDTLQHEINDTQDTIVVDITVRDKRDVAGLVKISQSLVSSKLLCCTGPQIMQTFHSASITDIVSEMLLEIDRGVSVLCDNGDQIFVKAGAIAVSISSPGDVIQEEDQKALEAAGKAQRLLMSRQHTTPPVCVEMPPFSTLHSAVLTQLLNNGAVSDRLILCGCNVLSLSAVDYFLQLLESFPSVLLCVDAFGKVETPGTGPMYPNDREIIDAVKVLLSRGFSSQLVISMSIRYKMDLCKYGGNGFGHIGRSVVPRMMELGVSREHIADMTTENAYRLLSWYVPPIKKEIEVETLPCYICGTQFVPGDHFEKFNFVYCSSKCLQAHRKRNWEAT